jgi:hypothetical protein
VIAAGVVIFGPEDVYLAAGDVVLVEPEGDFSDGSSVAHGEGEQTNEGAVGGVVAGAFDGVADGVGPVEDEDGDAVASGGAEAVGEGPDEGVDAAADIHDIEDEEVNVLEHGVGGFADFTVETVDRDLGAGVAVALPFDHVVLGVAPDAVLGAEGGGDIDLMVEEDVEGVVVVAVYGGLVTDETDTLSVESGAAFFNQLVETGESGE